MSWIPIRSLPPNPRRVRPLEKVTTMSLSLWTVACGAIHPTKLPAPTGVGPGADASAIHGRPGAQVALLQSPILPAVNSPYLQAKYFQHSPVDKPHTRHLRIPIFVWFVWFAVVCAWRAVASGRRRLRSLLPVQNPISAPCFQLSALALSSPRSSQFLSPRLCVCLIRVYRRPSAVSLLRPLR